MNIDVLPPDINQSDIDFTVSDTKIRFGLGAVKNVGVQAVQAIIAVRGQGGLYTNFADLCQRLDTKAINRRVLESLIKSGALDSLDHYRSQMMSQVDFGLGLAQLAQKDRTSGQLSLLDFWGDEVQKTLDIDMPNIAEFSNKELLNMEKETLGLYVSGHPLLEYQGALRHKATHQIVDLAALEDRTEVAVGGMINSIKKITTKKGDPMAFAGLEDLTGGAELVVFPRTYQQYSRLLQVDTPLLVQGAVDVSGDTAKILVNSMEVLARHTVGKLYVQLENSTRDIVIQVQKVLRSFTGECPVYIYFPREKKLAQADRCYWVNLSSGVIDELAGLLGAHNVKVKYDATAAENTPAQDLAHSQTN